MICSGLRSELPSVLVYPSLDDDLLIRVKLYGVTSLSVQIAEETVLPSSEWEIGHGRGHSDINADVACRGFVPESAPRRPAGCEKRSLVAIGTALQERHRLIHVARMDQAQYRAKDFRVGKLAGCGHTVENRRFHKVS